MSAIYVATDMHVDHIKPSTKALAERVIGFSNGIIPVSYFDMFN